MHSSLISGGDKIKMLFTAKKWCVMVFSKYNYLSIIWGKCLWTFSITFSKPKLFKTFKMPRIEPDICKKIFLNIHRKIGSNQTSNAKNTFQNYCISDLALVVLVPIPQIQSHIGLLSWNQPCFPLVNRKTDFIPL